MKIKIYLGLMALGINALAQQNPTGQGASGVGGPLGTNNIRGIGIGNFSTLGGAGVTPQARLHVNSFYIPVANSNATVIGLAGNLFRTDGSQNVINRWQMFIGGPILVSEKFKLFVPANTSNVSYNAEHTDGNLLTATISYFSLNKTSRFFLNI